MKTILALLILLAPVAPVAAWAACEGIKDHDQYAYCIAVSAHLAGQCGVVSDGNLRRECYARVTGSASNCNTASSEWAKKQCENAAKLHGK